MDNMWIECDFKVENFFFIIHQIFFHILFTPYSHTYQQVMNMDKAFYNQGF